MKHFLSMFFDLEGIKGESHEAETHLPLRSNQVPHFVFCDVFDISYRFLAKCGDTMKKRVF